MVPILNLVKLMRNKIERLLSTYLNYYPRYVLYTVLLLSKLNFSHLICFQWKWLFWKYLKLVQTNLILKK